MELRNITETEEQDVIALEEKMEKNFEKMFEKNIMVEIMRKRLESLKKLHLEIIETDSENEEDLPEESERN